MKRFQSSTFKTIEIDEIIEVVGEFKLNDYRFVQLCATTCESSCELLYAFIAPDATDGELTGIVVDVPDGASVPSITQFYPAAFVFENETHDLFGVDIYGINLDFQGEFYVVSGKYPMNPRAAQEQAAEAREEAAHE